MIAVQSTTSAVPTAHCPPTSTSEPPLCASPTHKARVSSCSVRTTLRAEASEPAQKRSSFQLPPTPTACGCTS